MGSSWPRATPTAVTSFLVLMIRIAPLSYAVVWNCGGYNENSPQVGVIEWVAHPNNHSVHNCLWHLDAPERHYLNLSIIKFDIPNHTGRATKPSACSTNHLTIIDNLTDKRLGRYCNDNRPPPSIVSPWNQLKIMLIIENATAGSTFDLEHKVMSLELSPEIMDQIILHAEGQEDESTISIGVVCLDGWDFYRGSCYRLFNQSEPLGWYDAESKCRAHGEGHNGHLVSINDRDEMLFVHYMLTNVWRTTKFRQLYIGLSAAEHNGAYRWSDSKPMSYTDWEREYILLEDKAMLPQPDGGAQEGCTVIRFNSYSRTSNWHDVHCSRGGHDSKNRNEVDPHSAAHNALYQLSRDHIVDSYICKSGPSHFLGLAHHFKMRLFTQDKPSNLSSELSLASQDGSRYFVCNNQEMINVLYRCDGIKHCRDGSDESTDCSPDCLDWQFKCANGRCISIGFYCNFVDDCGDNSDEAKCVRRGCEPNEYRCTSGQCIPAERRCDLMPDCSDQSDEGESCTSDRVCNKDSGFQCSSGECIPQGAICDFQVDCPGRLNEDENSVTCDILLKDRYISYKSQLVNRNHDRSQTIGPYSTALESSSGELYFTCLSGNMINASRRCLYEFDKYGYQVGCRDVSHLADCADFGCPQPDFTKCPYSYCIPRRYLCDGKWDCPDGDDEIDCDEYVCPGQYKCVDRSSCISLLQLCDGERQCPMGDDELFCDLYCLEECHCIGESVNCRGANLSILPSHYISKSVRKLDLAHNNLGPNLTNCNFSRYIDLGEIILQHNKIEVLLERRFKGLDNLYKLDLSHNRIHSIKTGAFLYLRRLTQLLLSPNSELANLEPSAFSGLLSLEVLNITSSQVEILSSHIFDGLYSLKHLALRDNMIAEIEDGAFKSLTSLASIDVRGNERLNFNESVLAGLKFLRHLYVDCHMYYQIPRNHSVLAEIELDSGCMNMISSVPQRVCIWIAAVLACAGNMIVIAWRYRDPLELRTRETDQVNSALLFSLSCSDLLMGIYLLIIASVNSWYREQYIKSSDKWHESIGCNICGLLSTTSSSASALMLAIIAYNQYIVICLPLSSPSRLTPGYTRRLLCAVWLVAATIAAVPLIVWPYFKGQFYSNNDVCLPYYIVDQRAIGLLYSLLFTQLLNFIAFSLAVYWYFQINAEKSRPSDIRKHSNERANNRIFFILLTHFVGLSPPIIIGFMKCSHYRPTPTFFLWVVALVLPINSIVHPFMYTFPNIRVSIDRLMQNYRAKKTSAPVVIVKSAKRQGPTVSAELVSSQSKERGLIVVYRSLPGSKKLAHREAHHLEHQSV